MGGLQLGIEAFCTAHFAVRQDAQGRELLGALRDRIVCGANIVFLHPGQHP
jgi:hypothetical protein